MVVDLRFEKEKKRCFRGAKGDYLDNLQGTVASAKTAGQLTTQELSHRDLSCSDEINAS
jgi:hypothetical protein